MANLEAKVPSSCIDETARLRRLISRIALSGLALTGGGVSSIVLESFQPDAAYASSIDDALNAYPDKSMPCEHSPYNVSGPCNYYDWGPTHTEKSGDSSELSSRGYAYRNCTDWVAWRESQVGVTVPHNLGNGGQWWENAPDDEKSRVPEAWDAAVQPGDPGHVAFIESVNSVDQNNPLNDNITVSEYNYHGDGTGDVRTGRAGDLGFTVFVDFGVHPASSSLAPSSNNHSHRHMLSDFNGDGKDDLVARVINIDYFDLNHNGGQAEHYNSFGPAGSEVYEGDFNGDGRTDMMVREGNKFYMDFDGNGGIADKVISFGRPSDQVYIGDFNGDGRDDILLRRGNTFFLNTSLRSVYPNKTYSYGRPGDEVYIGDFNGDGRDDVLLRRDNVDFVDYNNDGKTDKTSSFGRSGDWVYIGDFNGDNKDDIALRRGNVWYFDYAHNGGVADKAYSFGPSIIDSDDICIGDFDGNGTDDIAIREENVEYFDLTHNGGYADKSYSFGPDDAQMICRQ